jgi:hypothetical protein
VSTRKATLLLHRRVALEPAAFVEMVLWAVPRAVSGSVHLLKYRLSYVVRGEPVLRYDNESGKGDHKHLRGVETPYVFVNPETLLDDFWADVRRWNDEDPGS